MKLGPCNYDITINDNSSSGNSGVILVFGLCAFIFGFVDSHLINRYPNFILQLDPGAMGKNSSACRGSLAELTGPRGEFGIAKSQYKNDLQCGWKITVEAGKVIKGSVPPVFIF